MKQEGAETALMTFPQWLDANRFSNPQFAQELANELEIGQFSPRTVEKWRLGRAIPRKQSMAAILRIAARPTMVGRLTADSFYPQEEPACPS